MKPEDEEDVGQPRPLAVEPRHVLRVDEFRFRRHFMGDTMMTLALQNGKKAAPSNPSPQSCL